MSDGLGVEVNSSETSWHYVWVICIEWGEMTVVYQLHKKDNNLTLTGISDFVPTR